MGGQHQARIDRNGTTGRDDAQARPGFLEATDQKHKLHIKIGFRSPQFASVARSVSFGRGSKSHCSFDRSIVSGK